jgi:radical SAM protein with 4Fe4S-binding SPASM domain
MFPTHASYRAAWANAYKTDPAVPLNIDIELAAVCNLACPFCFWGEADFNEAMKKSASDGKPIKRLMPTEMAIKIIDEAAEIGVPALKFNWRGESTIHPDYSTIIRHARTKMKTDTGPFPGEKTMATFDCLVTTPAFFELLVNTNANCRDHAIDGLMNATKVMVSLDSLIPETYAKMRKGGDLKRAIDVTRELVERGHRNVWVRRVVTKDNAAEPFAFLARQVFGKAVHISEHAVFDRNEDERHAEDGKSAPAERTYCGYPSQRLMVSATGDVFPCCVDYDGTINVGKYPDQTLLEIWNGEPMVKLRETLRANRLSAAPAKCQNCTSWMAYKAPERDLVQDREVVI